MSESIYIRLAAPLQSWSGAKTTGNYVGTNSVPTSSALRGLIAASQGWKRGQWESWVEDATFTIRVDQAGSLIEEFQTISDHKDEREFRERLFVCTTLTAANGSAVKMVPGTGSTAISRRQYLAGAEFIVEIIHPDKIDQIVHGLVQTGFSIYLGRKAFSPTFPFYLGKGATGLLNQIPILDTTGEQKPRELWKEGSPTTKVTAPVVRRRDEWLAELHDQLS